MRPRKKESATEPSATPPEVGHILQKLRLSRNLTLDELARISDVSKSVLSQIERDRTNPTVGTLWRPGGMRCRVLLLTPAVHIPRSRNCAMTDEVPG